MQWLFPFFVLLLTAIFGIGGMWVAMRPTKPAGDANQNHLCEIAKFFLARSSFLGGLNQDINGVIYRGAGSAVMFARPLDTAAERPKVITTECLYRTADQLDFLLKGDFRLNGQHSVMEKMWIEPLSRTEAQSWILLHAQGQDMSHV